MLLPLCVKRREFLVSRLSCFSSWFLSTVVTGKCWGERRDWKAWSWSQWNRLNHVYHSASIYPASPGGFIQEARWIDPENSCLLQLHFSCYFSALTQSEQTSHRLNLAEEPAWRTWLRNLAEEPAWGTCLKNLPLLYWWLPTELLCCGNIFFSFLFYGKHLLSSYLIIYLMDEEATSGDFDN